jgi:class 3 adenylate cyclase
LYPTLLTCLFAPGYTVDQFLRGKNARFELFGGKVNTASRMKSTDARNKVEVSTKTVELLIAAGKSHWVTPRRETVAAKGEGQHETFWLTMRSEALHI